MLVALVEPGITPPNQLPELFQVPFPDAPDHVMTCARAEWNGNRAAAAATAGITCVTSERMRDARLMANEEPGRWDGMRVVFMTWELGKEERPETGSLSFRQDELDAQDGNIEEKPQTWREKKGGLKKPKF